MAWEGLLWLQDFNARTIQNLLSMTKYLLGQTVTYP